MKNVQTSAQTRTSVRPYADNERGADCADLEGTGGGVAVAATTVQSQSESLASDAGHIHISCLSEERTAITAGNKTPPAAPGR